MGCGASSPSPVANQAAKPQAAPPAKAPAKEQAAPPAKEQTAPPAKEQAAPPAKEQAAPPAKEQAAPPAEEQAAPPAKEQAAPPAKEQSAPTVAEVPNSDQAIASKVVVITGASSGIGRAIALALAKTPESYRLVLAARRKEELDAVVAAVGGSEVAIAVVTDVTKREDVKALLAAAAAKWGRIDVLVNNAGVGCMTLPTALDDSDLDNMMTINVKSALYGMQEVLPYIGTNGGQIVNVSSVLARVPVISDAALVSSAYSAAKAYLTSLTDTFRAEMKSTNPKIIVTSFFPGPVDTSFGTNAGSVPSAANPMAQNVDEVATIFVEEVIVKGREEVYTRPAYPELATNYLAAVHSK